MKIEVGKIYINKYGHKVRVTQIMDKLTWFDYVDEPGGNFEYGGVAEREWRAE